MPMNRKKKLKGAYKLTPKKLIKCKTCKQLRRYIMRFLVIFRIIKLSP